MVFKGADAPLTSNRWSGDWTEKSAQMQKATTAHNRQQKELIVRRVAEQKRGRYELTWYCHGMGGVQIAKQGKDR